MTEPAPELTGAQRKYLRGLAHHLQPPPRIVEPPVGVCEEVELELSNAGLELIDQRKRCVLQAVRRLLRIEHGQRLENRVAWLDVVAVVRPEHLGLVHPQGRILGCPRAAFGAAPDRQAALDPGRRAWRR